MRLNRQHWAAKGRPVSAETVRKRLGIGAAEARMLTHAVREADRVAVKAAGLVADDQSFGVEGLNATPAAVRP